MHRVSFSAGLTIIGIVLGIVLVVLVQAGKMKNPMTLTVWLTIAAILLLPLALGNTWVTSATSSTLKFAKGFLMFCVVGILYAGVMIYTFAPSNDIILHPTQKETDPQINDPEITKSPPDLAKAKRYIAITSINQFEDSSDRSKLKDVSTIEPGFFEFLADLTDEPYSHPVVRTKDAISTHYYASIRMAAVENVQTMDFMGLGIWLCISPDWRYYYIYEGAQLQGMGWQPIKVEISPDVNYLAIEQNERIIDIYINGKYVKSYTKHVSPQSGPLAVSFKANKKTGGKMFFREFAVWDFGTTKP